MKALILAAGRGTRLMPHTAHRPKPLFTLCGTPLLGLTIDRLIHAGCEHIVVNTHHLHGQVRQFIHQETWPVPVETRYEPILLDTGGAIKNVRDIMGDHPFWVINSDIVTDLDLRRMWDFHMNGNWPATLVLHDYPRFNGVAVNDAGFITGFPGPGDISLIPGEHTSRNQGTQNPCEGMAATPSPRKMAFTGIQILSPSIFDHLPDTNIFSSIDVYKKLCHLGNSVKAFVANDFYWQDMGTPDTYKDAGLRELFMTAPRANQRKTAIQDSATSMADTRDEQLRQEIAITPLAGDGSDRKWYRLCHYDTSFVVADHGIDPLPMGKLPPSPREVDAFINIGSHLYNHQLPVPKIMGYDLFSGLVMLEDLGDIHFQKLILDLRNHENHEQEIFSWYKTALDLVMDLSIKGRQGFDTAWTFQTPDYSRELILEKECRYFVDAFLRGYLNLDVAFEDLLPPFEFIADKCLAHAFTGLMHRDLQSRNIMVTRGRLRIIDFQSARTGPLQYDVASLLIDPYVNLGTRLRQMLLDHCAKAVNHRTGFDESTFKTGYYYCALTRNFQMLGAFSHLSRNRGKTWFEPFIRPALETLATAIHAVAIPGAEVLKQNIEKTLKAVS